MAKEFDSVLLVLLDENFNATEIYEAERSAVLAALATPGSKARNERDALPIAKFKAIGRLRWKYVRDNTVREQTPENPSFTRQTQSEVL